MEDKNCRILRFPSFSDHRGKLTVIEGGEAVPFEICRVFFLHGLTIDSVRGGHATQNDQCIIVMTGACKIRIHDGEHEKIFTLDEPMCGVYIPAMVWREIYDCRDNCMLAVLSDKHYDPNDYVRDFESFLRLCTVQKDKKTIERA